MASKALLSKGVDNDIDIQIEKVARKNTSLSDSTSNIKRRRERVLPFDSNIKPRVPIIKGMNKTGR